MACSSKFNADIKVIEITYFGQVTIDEVHKTFQEALDLSYQHQVTKGLIDCLHLQPVGSVFNIYDLASQLEKIPNIRQLKGAIILPILPESAEELRFFETAARNRGINVLVFSSREEAVMWLL